MICPECKREYVTGINECSDCKIALVEELPSQLEVPPGRKLEYATLFSIIGISYNFVVRNIGTFFPGLFKNLTVVRVSESLSFLASLTLLFFFISFYGDYVKREQKKLKLASIFVVVGSTAMAILRVRGLLLIYKADVLPFLRGARFIRAVEPVIPWWNSIFILIFFYIFYRELHHEKQTTLIKPTLFAVMGSSIIALMSTFILHTYFYTRQVRWLADLPRKVIYSLFPISVFCVTTILYFFLVFYKEQRRRRL